MILIIAYGNNLREDDGAGLLLAERLATVWQSRGKLVHCIVVHQLVPELAVDIAGDGVSAVVFVDTRVYTLPDNQHVQVARVEPAGEQAPSMGHHFQPGVLLAYAAMLSTADLLPPAWLVTVPGVAFGYGQQISEAAQAAIETAFDDEGSQLQTLIAALSSLD